MRSALLRNAAIAVIVALSCLTAFGQNSEADLDQKLTEYGKMDQGVKVLVFSHETPATKAGLFKRNIAGKANKLLLTTEQKEFLRMAFNKLKPEGFIEGTPENAELKALEAEANKLFTEKEIKALFMVKELGAGIENTVFFGAINYKQLSADPAAMYDCYCASSSDCISASKGAYRCELYLHMCTPAGSCGFWGMYQCRGGCVYDING